MHASVCHQDCTLISVKEATDWLFTMHENSPISPLVIHFNIDSTILDAELFPHIIIYDKFFLK